MTTEAFLGRFGNYGDSGHSSVAVCSNRPQGYSVREGDQEMKEFSFALVPKKETGMRGTNMAST